jgi:hypothetical protein
MTYWLQAVVGMYIGEVGQNSPTFFLFFILQHNHQTLHQHYQLIRSPTHTHFFILNNHQNGQGEGSGFQLPLQGWQA